MKIIQQTNQTLKQMMGYTVIARTGEVLVVDGGAPGNGNELRRVIKKAGGHVSLWLITHPHSDHHDAIIEVLSDPQGVTYDRLGSSFLSDEWAARTGVTDADELVTWNAFSKNLDQRYFEVKEGQTFDLGSMHVEILAGANPDILTNPMNNQSVVIRVSEDNFTMLFLGDLGVEAGKRLMAKKLDLRADAVQMAHHGQQGVEENVYGAISPRIAFWPTPDWLWDNTPYLGGTPGTGPFKTQEVAAWMKKLGTRNVLDFKHTVVFDTADETVKEY